MRRGLKVFQAPVRWILNFVYPPLCVVCGAPLGDAPGPLCPVCAKKLIPLQDTNDLSALWITRQKSVPVFLDGFLAGFLFESTIQALIHALKYQNQRQVGLFLGGKLAERLRTVWVAEKMDWIVPVPLHRKRRRSRGYNQSTLLARAISERTGIPCSEKILRRVRNTPTNTGLTASERFENMQNGFEIFPGRAVEGQSFLLVDDVITTGSTTNACAEPLKRGGARQVLALAVAHPALE